MTHTTICFKRFSDARQSRSLPINGSSIEPRFVNVHRQPIRLLQIDLHQLELHELKRGIERASGTNGFKVESDHELHSPVGLVGDRVRIESKLQQELIH